MGDEFVFGEGDVTPRSGHRRALRDPVLKVSPRNVDLENTPPSGNTRASRRKEGSVQKVQQTARQKHSPTAGEKKSTTSAKSLRPRPRQQVGASTKQASPVGDPKTTQRRAQPSPAKKVRQKTEKNPPMKTAPDSVKAALLSHKLANLHLVSQDVQPIVVLNNISYSGITGDGNTTPSTAFKEPDAHRFKVPDTPGLNTAILKTPAPVSRRLAAETELSDSLGGVEDLDLEETLDDNAIPEAEALPVLGGKFESTKIAPGMSRAYAEDRAPLRWSLRQLSPIRGQEADPDDASLPFSSSDETPPSMHDVAVQTSLCAKCSSHRAWSEMRPVVMIFVLMMITLLYKGLLTSNSNISETVANGLGMATAGSFLTSFNLEEYFNYIFHE